MKPVLALVAAIVLTGCGKHTDATGSGAAGNATVSGDAAVAPAGTDFSGTLSDLTQALRKFSMENRRFPKDLAELTGAGYIPGLPPAPAGKKFAIDQKKVQVVLVNQ